MRAWTVDTGAVAPQGRSAVGLPSGALYVYIVSAMDGARFAVVATAEQECVTKMAAYIAEQAPLQLWPASARCVQELLAAGNEAAAIAEYFRRAGERWDREWLVTTSLNPDLRAGTWSGPVPLPGLTDRAGTTRRISFRATDARTRSHRGAQARP